MPYETILGMKQIDTCKAFRLKSFIHGECSSWVHCHNYYSHFLVLTMPFDEYVLLSPVTKLRG